MQPFSLVTFGITSNIVQKYLIPSLYDMEEKGLLPANMIIVGIARRQMSEKDLADYLHQTLHLENLHHKHEIKAEVFQKLCKKFCYLSGEIEDRDLYEKLKKTIGEGNIIYYLATYPELYKYVFDNLQKVGLNKQKSGWVRLMIEKPIGHDLLSAKELNELLLNYFTEDHIDHIQITALEDFGIGKRGGYYDQVGALKDVGQNHLLQMLAFATMDAPGELSNEAVTRERIKILKNLQSLTDKVVFGQYEGYIKEENVAHDSATETFYALKTYIRNERFKDIPIYIRAGKKLKKTATEISIVFKKPANRLFKCFDCGEDEPNVLIYRIQPNEAIVFKILTKLPGHKVKLQPEYMQYCYRIDPHNHYIPDPYERLLVDTIRGDQTFFNDAAEIEAQWAFVDPLIEVRKKPVVYQAGSWGPKEADELIEKDGRNWILASLRCF